MMTPQERALQRYQRRTAIVKPRTRNSDIPRQRRIGEGVAAEHEKRTCNLPRPIGKPLKEHEH
jgi:hypothetical protein